MAGPRSAKSRDKQESVRLLEEIQRSESGNPVRDVTPANDPNDPAVALGFTTADARYVQAKDEHEQQHRENLEQVKENEKKAKEDANRRNFVNVGTDERSLNELRPKTFKEIIGQKRVKRLLERVIEATLAQGRALDHTLIVGASGVGKSTFSHVIAHELGVKVYEVEAPVSLDDLLDLRMVMQPRDILRVEEIHQQAISERRGKSAQTQPEVLYSVMEDRVITTPTGTQPFPPITIIGTTTDEGMLPDAFVNRFPLRPVLEEYSLGELKQLAQLNAKALGIDLTPGAAKSFAAASRGTPRQVNNYVRNALTLAPATLKVDAKIAKDVLIELNRVTEDGLTSDMQNMLVFLYERGKRKTSAGEVLHQASVSTIATGIGKSRDSKAILMRVEPWLIREGLISVTHGGRRLTDGGIGRAKTLAKTGGRP